MYHLHCTLYMCVRYNLGILSYLQERLLSPQVTYNVHGTNPGHDATLYQHILSDATKSYATVQCKSPHPNGRYIFFGVHFVAFSLITSYTGTTWDNKDLATKYKQYYMSNQQNYRKYTYYCASIYNMHNKVFTLYSAHCTLFSVWYTNMFNTISRQNGT